MKDSSNAGDYQQLYKYLRDRYADRVVLTFGQIEDLVGFTLPSAARVQPEWWSCSVDTSHRTAQSDAWTSASRTATANLVSCSVVFERDIPPHTMRGK